MNHLHDPQNQTPTTGPALMHQVGPLSLGLREDFKSELESITTEARLRFPATYPKELPRQDSNLEWRYQKPLCCQLHHGEKWGRHLV